ncbi:MAG: hypothetical protein R3F65_32045 [bacterium]
MSFTTIINGEGDAMRQLEQKDAAAKPAAKTTTTTRRAKKPGEAQLVLANGEVGEATRLGLTLVGAGLTAATVGMLEGMARKGKVQWWSKLTPQKRGLLMMTIVVGAGLVARHRRRGGHIKSATALEAAATAAWTLALIYFIEGGASGSKVGGLGGDVGEMGVDELKALDSQIDDDIQSAARRLRDMAERERSARSEMAAEAEAEAEDVGALAYQGEWDLDDDDIF